MDKKSLDLTIFFSNELCQILSRAASDAKRSKNEYIDIEHILYELVLYDSRVRDLLSSTGQLSSTQNSIIQKLQTKEKWKQSPEKILMTMNARNALMHSLQEAVLLQDKLISPLAMFLSISRLGLSGVAYENLARSLNLVQGITLEEQNITPLPEGVIEVTSMPDETLHQYVERTQYTDQIIRLLYKDTKKNILLVGNQGIGKRSTKFLLARKARENGNIFEGSHIYTLDAGKISYINATDTIRKLQKEVGLYPQESSKFVVYIDNLEVGGNEQVKEYSMISSLFEAILGSQIFGVFPVTYAQQQALLKSFPNMSNTTEIIYIDEPDMELAQQMVTAKYKDYTNMSISEDTIRNTVTLAKRFTHEKFLPESAIALLDEAVSQARIDGQSEVTVNDIKKILSQKTGIPLTDISEAEAGDLQNLEITLKETVIGQDDAVVAVAKTIKRSRAGLKDPKRPIGSFLFIGPSGTGKTQLAKALAKVIYKDENAMIRLDMSEYTDSHTVDRLIGAPPGYVGYEEGGQLTNKVLKKPYSLILLDEVEKANPKVFDIFLQVLDDGRLTDGQGKTVDFKNTIIIMTSNLIDDDMLSKFFRPEFLNRIDQIIKFKPLTPDVGKSIVQLFVKDLKARLLEKHITLDVSDEVITQIANEGISDKYGARPLRRLVEEKIEDPLVEKIISGEIKEGQTITWNQI